MRVFFVPNHRFYHVLALMLVLAFVVAPVAAQDTVATENPLLEVPSPDVLVNTLAAAFLAALAGVLASPVTSSLVAIVKRLPIPFIQNASGAAINLCVSAVLIGVVYLAQFLGIRPQLDTLFQIILALAPIAVGTTFAAKSSQGYYQKVANGLPVLGTGRKSQAT